MQLNDTPFETHKPLFLHVVLVHRFICRLHKGPVNPGLQIQVYEYSLSLLEQNPFEHGFDAHGSKVDSHLKPW